MDGIKLQQKDIDFLALTPFTHLSLNLSINKLNLSALFENLQLVRTLVLGLTAESPEFILNCPLLVEIRLENMPYLKRVEVLSKRLEVFDILGCGTAGTKNSENQPVSIELVTSNLRKLKVRSSQILQSQIEAIAFKNPFIRIFEVSRTSITLSRLLRYLPNLKTLTVMDDSEGTELYTALVAHSVQHPLGLVRLNSCSKLLAKDLEYLAKSLKCRKILIGGFHSWLDDKIQQQFTKKYKHLVFKDN